ncbi:endospore germination permease [Paenibacillus cisolokensis]|uniref:GerAB/ArcD/ProY family transporter n=1 Tax=Paenibacillus cisolokensis TaxID=1658519 RepID=UPI003D2C7626
MIEKGKISALQLGMLMYLVIAPTAILNSPSISFRYAKQDLWISPIWSLSGWMTIYLAFKLHDMYPGHNIVQASERIIGRWPGKVIGFLILFIYLYINSGTTRLYSEFVSEAFLPETPLIVVSGTMVLVCAIASRGGVEITGRFAQLILPVFIVLFLSNVLPIIPDLEPLNIFPVMAEGIMPSVAGSTVLQSWYCQFITVTFLLPFVSDREKAAKSVSIALIAVIVTLVIANLVTLLLLGEITGHFTYPFLILARYISLAEFFSHLESLYVAIWVFGAFMKIYLFFYVLVLAAAQWMNLSDYRPIVYPLGFILIVFSHWIANNLQELIHALGTSVTFTILTVLLGVPMLLFCIALVKKRGHGTVSKN